MLEAVREHLKREAYRPINSDRCLGFHGMSLETLEYALETGFIPGRTGPEKRLSPTYVVHPGDIYYYENEDDLHGAEIYAKQSAAQYYFASKLGLRLDYREDLDLALRLVNNPMGPDGQDSATVEKLMARQFPRQKILATLAEANQQRGLVIGLHPNLIVMYPIENCETLYGDDGWRIITGSEGLPVKYIRGIRPLGEREKAFLNSI